MQSAGKAQDTVQESLCSGAETAECSLWDADGRVASEREYDRQGKIEEYNHHGRIDIALTR